ncbi:hypothetical protein AVEN_197888-1 [Araneus ventricosus]|uniref:Uncharacterized protein n=1 Tax=Araneus ventricosus TaxID=182803 RepID=A0A4Y2CKK5_ARAVE|nr:hypothetical protein AVEN_197888-1 [Araneus ventricosus]
MYIRWYDEEVSSEGLSYSSDHDSKLSGLSLTVSLYTIKLLMHMHMHMNKWIAHIKMCLIPHLHKSRGDLEAASESEGPWFETRFHQRFVVSEDMVHVQFIQLKRSRRVV